MASKAQDARAMQIEITGYSNIARWLPFRPALRPLVALVAFLHQRKLIKTGLSRPTDDWPIAVDHLPAAVLDYYRRTAGLWPDVPGVYGHIGTSSSRGVRIPVHRLRTDPMISRKDGDRRASPRTTHSPFSPRVSEALGSSSTLAK
jgi:hypothetical protein